MANILFKQGSYAGFKGLTAHEAGALYFTTDEGGLYLGTGTGANDYIRIQGSVQYFATLSTFNDAVVEKPPYAADVIYFVADKDALIRYDAVNKKWVQLNVTAATFAALESTVSGHTESIGTINSSISNLNSAVLELQELVGISSGEGDAESLGDRIAALENWKANDYVTDYTNLSNRIGAAKNGDTEASGVYAYVDSQIEGVNGSINTINGSITSINGTLDTLATKTSVETLSQTVGGHTTKLNEHNAAIAGNTSAIEGLQSTKADASTVSALSGTVDGISSTVVELGNTKADKETVNSLVTTVGNSSSGLVKDVADLKAIDHISRDEFNSVKTLATNAATQGTVSAIDGRVGALETGLTTLNGTIGDSTKGLVKKVNDLESTIGDSTNGLNTKVSIADFNAYKTTAKKYVDDTAAAINESIGTINGQIGTINTALTGKVETSVFNQYKTDAKNYVDGQISGVNSYIDGKINAANGLVFKATITSWSQLPTSGVSIGDTYVIGDATITEGDKTYYAGDLLIASGNEENGIITSGLTWEHVKTGYTDMYEAELTGADNKIKLKSYTEKPLGEIEVKSNNDNIKVSVEDNKIIIGMEWGTF